MKTQIKGEGGLVSLYDLKGLGRNSSTTASEQEQRMLLSVYIHLCHRVPKT
jgi:hypothetical protein